MTIARHRTEVIPSPLTVNNNNNNNNNSEMMLLIMRYQHSRSKARIKIVKSPRLKKVITTTGIV